MNKRDIAVVVQWIGVLLITIALYLQEGSAVAMIAVGMYLVVVTMGEL